MKYTSNDKNIIMFEDLEIFTFIYKDIGKLPVYRLIDGFLRPVHTVVTYTPLFTAGQVFTDRPLAPTVMGVHVRGPGSSYNNFSLYGKVIYVHIPEQLLLNRPISY